MTTPEMKNLIERVIIYLRGKNARKEEMKCTLEDIIGTFGREEKREYQIFTHPDFINSFYESVKNNPKIHFDPNRRQFTFKNNFHSINDFINKLHTNKMGILENEDLYDDLDCDQIAKLKQGGLIREIYMKEKKTKPAIIVLFSKNHVENEVDKLKLEDKTSAFLKNYWQKIEKDALELEKSNKFSNIIYMGKNRGKKNKKIRKKNLREEDPKYWKNKHLSSKITEAFKKLEKIVLITHKNKFKKY